MVTPRTRSIVGVTLLVAGTAALALSGDLRVHASAYLALYVVVAVGYTLILWAGPSLGWPTVVLVALLLRALLFPSAPSLSDDYHRYLWDGRVQVAGINPYRYAPADPALDSVQYSARDRINHPTLPTIYPALAQNLFYGLARVGVDSPAGLKLVFGFFELLTAVVIAAVAGRQRRRGAVTMYLLHPLVLQETWSSAHLEAVPVFFVLLCLLLVIRRRDIGAGVALGAATALKLTPAFLLVPALVGARVRPGRFALGFVPAFALPYVPYVLSGTFLGTLHSTGATPEFNASVFWVLRAVMPYDLARVVAAALFVAGGIWLSRRFSGRERAPIAFAATATLALLLLPVVFPWYWLAPVALAAAAGIRLPLYLGLTAPASYASYLATPPGQKIWARMVAYAPLAALLRVRSGGL
jgi:alpha-1,6-mannosyltransferase